MSIIDFKESKEKNVGRNIIDLLSELSPYIDKMKKSNKAIFFEQQNMLNFRLKEKSIDSLMYELECALDEYSCNPSWYANYVFVIISELYNLVNQTIKGMAICDEFSIDSSEPVAESIEVWVARCQSLIDYSKNALSKSKMEQFKNGVISMYIYSVMCMPDIEK